MTQETKARSLIPPRNDKNKPDVVQDDVRQLTGRVITFGDIHGTPVFRQRVLPTLTANDRVVLVGDLIDRGRESFEVVNTIRQDPRFMAVRGNHEESFLQYFNIRKSLILDHVDRNLLSRTDHSSLQYAYNRLQTHYKKSEQEANHVVTFLMNGGGWAQHKTLEELQPLATYFDALPYIRQVQAPNGTFLVGHADLSILSDKDLASFYETTGKTLSDEQKAHITWARAADIKKNEYITTGNCRNKDSCRVYVGHEIVTRGYDYAEDKINVFREESNHYNLDFGASENGVLVGIEHPKRVVVFGYLPNGAHLHKFYAPLSEIRSHFQEIVFDSVEGLKQYTSYSLSHPNSNCHVRLTQQQFDQDFRVQNFPLFKNADLTGVKLSPRNLRALHSVNGDAPVPDIDLTNITPQQAIALKTQAPLLTLEQYIELLRFQNSIVSADQLVSGDVSEEQPIKILAAMSAAIAACGDADKVGKEKKQTLEALKKMYNTLQSTSESPNLDSADRNDYVNTLIKTFVTVAATARQRKFDFMTADFGATKSVKAFYKALDNTDTNKLVHNALVKKTTDSAHQPTAIPERKFYKFDQFKDYLTKMKLEAQEPYGPANPGPRK